MEDRNSRGPVARARVAAVAAGGNNRSPPLSKESVGCSIWMPQEC